MNADPPAFVYQAPESCPSADDFRGRVRGWLANASSGAGAASVGDEALRGGSLRLSRGDDHEMHGEATLPRTNVQRSLHAATCEELVAAYVFVFAVDLDERVMDHAGEAPPPPSPSPAPAPAPAPEVVTPIEAPRLNKSTNDVPASPPLHLVWSATLLSGAANGLLPGTAYRESAEFQAAFVRDQRWSPALRLGFDYDTPVSAYPGGGYQSTFTSGALRLDLCPIDRARRSPVYVSICARVAVVAVFASGSAGPHVRDSTRFVPTAALAPRFAIPIGMHVALGIDMSLGIPFVRDRYTLEDGTRFVTRTAPIAESAQAFAAWTF